MSDFVTAPETHRPYSTMLSEILVLAERRGFWASESCKVFPNILNPTTDKVVPELLTAYALILLAAWGNPIPETILRWKRKGRLGSSTKLAFVDYKGLRYLRKDTASMAECWVIHSRSESQLRRPHAEKLVFVPLPVDRLANRYRTFGGEYVFCGGRKNRDYESLAAALRRTDVSAAVVISRKRRRTSVARWPANCFIHDEMPIHDYTTLMAGSRFVVVPLNPRLASQGQTEITMALALGKPVISTRNAAVDDYIQDSIEGFLVEPGDVQEYAATIRHLFEDTELRRRMSKAALQKAEELHYDKHADRLVALCMTLLNT